MSSESITTALFLITAVVASAVLINAMYPVIQNMAGTFSSSTHESDVRIRTDFKIIATHASDGTVQVWMKNIGSERISLGEIQRSDVFCGAVGSFDHLTYNHVEPDNLASLAMDQWTEEFGTSYDLNANTFWDSGETLKVTAKTAFSSGDTIYFQFSLPNGIWRSIEFTAS
ncbi:MAG: flagellin [Methanoregula sp.]|nr:flagellin [Methanoregula sp.]